MPWIRKKQQAPIYSVLPSACHWALMLAFIVILLSCEVAVVVAGDVPLHYRHELKHHHRYVVKHGQQQRCSPGSPHRKLERYLDLGQQQQALNVGRHPITHWRFFDSASAANRRARRRRRAAAAAAGYAFWSIRGGAYDFGPDSTNTNSERSYSSPSSASSSTSPPEAADPHHQIPPPQQGIPSSSLSSSSSSLPSVPSPPPAAAAPPAAASASAVMTTTTSPPNGYIPMPLPAVTPPKPRYLDVISIYANGTAWKHQVRKSELSVEIRCPTRDLRLIDTSFPSSVATFLARRQAIVLRMDRIRAVIRWGEVMLFDPSSKDVATLVPTFQQQLAAAALSPPSMVSPFEFLALEAILANVCHMVHEHLQQLSPHIARILGDLKFRHGTLSSFPKLLDELLPLRNDLSELHYTVQELRKALNDVLLSDEDMEKMHFSAKPAIGGRGRHGRRVGLGGGGGGGGGDHDHHHHHAQQSQQQHQQGHHHPQDQDLENNHHQEVEMMFENYLMQLEWADTEIREIQHAIRNTEDTVEIQLDLLRNRILRFELVLNIVASVISFGCLVTGLFGMNLLSGYENHGKAFYLVTGVGAFIMFGMLGLALFYGSHAKLL